MADQAKERVITVASKEQKSLPSGKTLWNVTDADGVRFSVWSAKLQEPMNDDSEVKVKFVESKNGKFTNRSIVAVAIKDDEGGWGEWQEQERKAFTPGAGGGKSFGKSPQDVENINTAVCLKAATDIICAAIAKAKETGSFSQHRVALVTLTKELKGELFDKRADAAGAKAAPKRLTVKDANNTVEEKEEVPF